MHVGYAHDHDARDAAPLKNWRGKVPAGCQAVGEGEGPTRGASGELLGAAPGWQGPGKRGVRARESGQVYVKAWSGPLLHSISPVEILEPCLPMNPIKDLRLDALHILCKDARDVTKPSTQRQASKPKVRGCPPP